MGSRSVRVNHPHRHAARVVATLAVLALVAASCTRDNKDVSSGPSSSTTSGGSSTPDNGAAGPGDFGTLKDVCGPAPSGEKNTASDQGVTADQIEVGTTSAP